MEDTDPKPENSSFPNWSGKVLGAELEENIEVDHPKHYGGDTQHEVIKCLEAWFSQEEFTGFLKGNCIKYLARAGKKGFTSTDLEKARWYLDHLIERSKNGA